MLNMLDMFLCLFGFWRFWLQFHRLDIFQNDQQNFTSQDIMVLQVLTLWFVKINHSPLAPSAEYLIEQTHISCQHPAGFKSKWPPFISFSGGINNNWHSNSSVDCLPTLRSTIFCLTDMCHLNVSWSKGIIRYMSKHVNSFTHAQNGCHFAYNIFRCIFINE